MYYENGFAIVGVGCRFPGGIESLDGLWDVLAKGADVVTNVPDSRFSIRRYWHPERQAPGRTCTTAAGIVGDIKAFDAAFFGMSPKEAEALDPQQRMVLEMAWEAFEDAGIKPSSVAGTNAAVYIGAASTDMGMIHSDDLSVTGPYGMTGTSLSIIANRLSYYFDLHGPSMTIDTAC
ncbi:polyketide synthase, partial [Sutterella massiliensis]